MIRMPKFFIEETFPIKELSIEASKEKNRSYGHISRMLTWWARRPLTSSRASIYCSLILKQKNYRQKVKEIDYINTFSKLMHTNNQELITKAKIKISESFRGKFPKILDPFAGGGAIPLEALRLGCEVYACDYNPVAVLIEYCTLLFPVKFGLNLFNDLKRWRNWVLDKVKEEIYHYYEYKEQKIYAYIWTKTLKCIDPSCNAEIPVFRTFWLANKKNRKIALLPLIDGNQVSFRIVGSQSQKIPLNFNPNKGNYSRANLKCLCCNSKLKPIDVKTQCSKGLMKEKLIVVCYYDDNFKLKQYRIANDYDLKKFEESKKFLEVRVNELIRKWKYSPIPEESIPRGNGPGAERTFTLRNFSINQWGDLFNQRQKLCLLTFIKVIQEAYEEMRSSDYETEYAQAILTYLAVILAKLTTTSNVICRWNAKQESIMAKPDQSVFLNMQWNYPESNPLSEYGGGFLKHSESLINMKFLINDSSSKLQISLNSATKLPYKEEYFDAIFTDPPYYDNIPYSYLSDFFYVWLKRTIGFIYPKLFENDLTPKSDEIVAYTFDRSWDKAKNDYEMKIRRSFFEIYRVLKNEGIFVLIYAYNSIEGWEMVITSLLKAGFNIYACWPVSTEMKKRIRAIDSAAIASSIYIVAKKIKKEKVGVYSEIIQKLKTFLIMKAEILWSDEIYGSDFYISAIGAGIQIFGNYEKILDENGNETDIALLLQNIREIIVNYILSKIFQEEAMDFSPLTNFYILWRWNFRNSSIDYDEARKIAQLVGLKIQKKWEKGFIKKLKDKIKVLDPLERDTKELLKSKELIDILHLCLKSLKNGDKNQLVKTLFKIKKSQEKFFKVVYILIKILPSTLEERKMLDNLMINEEYCREKLKSMKNIVDYMD